MAIFPTVGQRAGRLRMTRRAVIAFLVTGVVLHLFPFYLLLVTSVKDPAEAQKFPPKLWPTDWNFDSWRLIVDLAVNPSIPDNLQFLQRPFWVYFLNSLFIALITLALSLPVTALAAYANSKLQTGRTARFSFLFFIGTMMVPFAVVLVPTFLLTRNFPFALPSAPDFPGTSTAMPTLTLWDTPWAVILPAVFVPFSFLLFKGFFDTIPDSIIQAARVDGGSEFNIFRRIVLPMSVPVFAVAAYTSFSSVWDNFLWQLLVLQSQDELTTSVSIYGLMQAFTRSGASGGAEAAAQSAQQQQIIDAGLSWNSLMVLGLLQTLPIFVTFIICREYLLRGIRIRGLK